MKITTAINQVITHLLDTDYIPLAWTAVECAADHHVPQQVNGLHNWPDMPTARVLTGTSANHVANMLAHRLNAGAVRYTANRQGNWRNAVLVIQQRARLIGGEQVREVEFFLNALRQRDIQAAQAA